MSLLAHSGFFGNAQHDMQLNCLIFSFLGRLLFDVERLCDDVTIVLVPVLSINGNLLFFDFLFKSISISSISFLILDHLILYIN